MNFIHFCRGQTPEQAEKNYLENAKKLPLYGVDLHLAQVCLKLLQLTFDG